MRWLSIVAAAVLLVSVGGRPAVAEGCVVTGSAEFDIAVPEPVGGLRITKYARDNEGFPTSLLLSDAYFDIEGAGGEVLGSGSTDQDGLLSFDGLAPGQYTVRETQAPPGYSLQFGPGPQTAEVRAGEVTELIFYNNPTPMRAAQDAEASGTPDPLPEAVPPPATGQSVAGPLAVPAAESSMTVELGAGLTFVAIDLDPAVTGLPEPQITGNTVTWDLTAVPPGRYRVVVQASATVPGTYPVTLRGTLQGEPLDQDAVITMADDPSCQPSTPAPEPVVPTVDPSDGPGVAGPPRTDAGAATPVLATTGTSSGPIMGAGAVLVVGGIAALAIRRAAHRGRLHS